METTGGWRHTTAGRSQDFQALSGGLGWEEQCLHGCFVWYAVPVFLLLYEAPVSEHRFAKNLISFKSASFFALKPHLNH
jgi:hypothetical protein